jgi:hypothetical protein
VRLISMFGPASHCKLKRQLRAARGEDRIYMTGKISQFGNTATMAHGRVCQMPGVNRQLRSGISMQAGLLFAAGPAGLPTSS